MDVYWPGKQYIDVLGFDPYNWYDTSNSSGAKNYTWTELRRVLHQDHGLAGCHRQQ